MNIEISIGPKTVTISTHEYAHNEESDLSWPKVMQELVFPALQGFGYAFDDEFMEQIGEIHRDHYRSNRENRRG
jgi:hypothetical protein